MEFNNRYEYGFTDGSPVQTPTIERSNSLALQVITINLRCFICFQRMCIFQCEVERLRSKLNFVISSAEQSLQDFSQAQVYIDTVKFQPYIVSFICILYRWRFKTLLLRKIELYCKKMKTCSKRMKRFVV